MEGAEKYIKKLIKPGYEYEIFKQRIRKLKVEVSEGDVESISASEESGLGLRVLKGGKLGFSYTSYPSEENLRDVVEKAIQMCELQNPDRGNVFVKELKEPGAESVFDEEGVETPLEGKIDIALELERKAKERDRRIVGVRKASFTERVLELEIENSYGVRYAYSGTFFTAMIAALAQDGGDSSISWELRGSRRLRDLDIDEIVREVVFKSTSLLKPKPMDTRVMPVLLMREASAMILEAFSSMFLGDAYVKGKTLLRERRGESVGSELLTVVDDGSLEGGFSTAPYDAEGIPQRRNVVVERGVFKGFLHSLYTSTLSGEEATGNSERDSYKNLPSSGITNLYIEVGDSPFEDLVSLEDEVLVVIDLMGLHTVDPISGEFSLGASGVLYRKGKPLHPVRGVTIAGNILDLWNKIVAVGNDIKFYGNVGSPSMLVRDMTVGGS